MENHSEFIIPESFNAIVQNCDKTVSLAIIGQEGLNHLSGDIISAARVTMIQCYIMQINLHLGDDTVTLYCAIGTDANGYRSSSPIQKIDFTNMRILTYSGNVYSFEALLKDVPNSLSISICTTLSNYRLNKACGLPHVFF